MAFAFMHRTYCYNHGCNAECSSEVTVDKTDQSVDLLCYYFFFKLLFSHKNQSISFLKQAVVILDMWNCVCLRGYRNAVVALLQFHQQYMSFHQQITHKISNFFLTGTYFSVCFVLLSVEWR